MKTIYTFPASRTAQITGILLLFILGGCGGKDVRTYEVRGRVVGPAFGGEAVIIDHESIPGYMDAMRMTLKLKDPALLDGIQPGDIVRFRLVVETSDTYIDQLERLAPETQLELASHPVGTASGGSR